MSPDDGIPFELLDRYVAGEATPSERMAVEEWCAANSERRGRLDTLAAELLVTAGSYTDPSIIAERILIRAPMDRESRPPAQIQSLRRGTEFRSRMPQSGSERHVVWRRVSLGAAAAIVVAVGFGVARFNSRAAHSVDASQSRTYATVTGQQATVTLVDGSRALLGPATTLRVTTQQSGAGVDVRVNGQALFTVAHSKERPFRVQTSNAVIRVLGTTFMMRQYDTDRIARVAVSEGRVSLAGMHNTAATGTGHVLGVNTLGTVDDSGRVQVTPNIAVEEYTGWTTGKLVFNKTPARDVVAELGRAYGVDIRIADSAHAEQPLSWTVSLAQRSLSDILGSLSAALEAHPVRNGNVITLVPGRSPSRRQISPSSPSLSENRYGQ